MRPKEKEQFGSRWDKLCKTAEGRHKWSTEVKKRWLKLKEENGGRAPRRKKQVFPKVA